MTVDEAYAAAVARYDRAPFMPDDPSFQWPKCLICHQRPTMMIKKTSWLLVLTGFNHEPKFIRCPRYEVLPCCSARWVKENQGLSKKQQRQVMEQVQRRKGGRAEVARPAVGLKAGAEEGPRADEGEPRPADS
jgi:hypothetical protein